MQYTHLGFFACHMCSSCLASGELGILMQGWCGGMSRACKLSCMVFRQLVYGSELLLGTGQSAPQGP